MKDKAIELRRRGKTLREIGQDLGIAVSTAHLWTRHIRLTPDQIRAIKKKHEKAWQLGRQKAGRIRAEKFRKEAEKYRLLGKQQIGKINNRELMLIGAALYWCEGFKKDSRLGFANSDPAMINLFLKWLIQIGNVPMRDIRLRVGVNIAYKDKVREIEERWSDLTGVGLDQF